MAENDVSGKVYIYHNRTKHFLNRYADSPGYLDWSSQPEPFRTYNGAQQYQLDRNPTFPSLKYSELFTTAQNPADLSSQNISCFFRMSLGLAAWKEFQGAKWALRINPSSGNLHAEEAYLVCAGLNDIEDGVHHYDSLHHRLERRVAPHKNFAKAMDNIAGFFVGLASIHWREEWKYGERSWRYTQLDIGHAIAALALASRMLGWRSSMVCNVSDSDLSSLFGVDRDPDFGDAEREVVDNLIYISTEKEIDIPADHTISTIVKGAVGGEWCGEANILSPSHTHGWPAIDEVAEAAIKPVTTETVDGDFAAASLKVNGDQKIAWQIISSRRSGQTYDGHTSIPAEKFIDILKSTLPDQNAAPFGVFGWEPLIHPIIFVHRVEGMEKGIYALLRRKGETEAMKGAMSKEFLWEISAVVPEGMELYLLARGDFKQASRVISCHQSIASDGCFSAGLLAEFDEPMTRGPWWYRRLFWEAGVVGHALYLACEAAQIRGTGIGCYFDDSFHEMLGLHSTSYQSIYHFTAGGAVEDERLTTHPPYGDSG